MAVDFIARFDGSRVLPVNPGEDEAMNSLARDVDYRVSCTRVRGRSVQHLRFLFALIKIARENYAQPITSEAVKEVLKLRTGHVNIVQLSTGEVIMFPASISFEKMDQDQFNQWFPRAVDVLCRDFCPGLDRVMAMREIEREAGAKWEPRQLEHARAT